MPQFAPGQTKTARAPITVKPAGLSCQAELYLGAKMATSGLKPFTSTGAEQSITFPLTMPSAAGTYPVYLDIFVAGQLIGAYQATEDVVIAAPLDAAVPGDLIQIYAYNDYPVLGQALVSNFRICYDPAPLPAYSVASDNVVYSDDAEVQTGAYEYTKVKEIRINSIISGCRIKFSLRRGANGAGVPYARIYQNGVAIGTERKYPGDPAHEFTEDFILHAIVPPVAPPPLPPTIAISGFHYVYQGAYTWTLSGSMIHGGDITHIGFSFVNVAGVDIPGVSLKMRIVQQLAFHWVFDEETQTFIKVGYPVADTELSVALNQYQGGISQPFTLPAAPGLAPWGVNQVWYGWGPPSLLAAVAVAEVYVNGVLVATASMPFVVTYD